MIIQNLVGLLVFPFIYLKIPDILLMSALKLVTEKD